MVITLNLLWLIPVMPLLGAAINGAFGKRLPRGVIGAIASGSVAVSFAISLVAFLQMLSMPEDSLPIIQNYFTWIQAGSFQAVCGFSDHRVPGLFQQAPQATANDTVVVSQQHAQGRPPSSALATEDKWRVSYRHLRRSQSPLHPPVP